MAKVASEEVLQQAFDWLCARRKQYSPNDDVWILRARWPTFKPLLRRSLLAGLYRLDAVRQIRFDDDTLEIWSAMDALVGRLGAGNRYD